MGEQLEARKDEALTAVEEAIYGALKRADLLREVGPFLRQILALEALGAVLSVVRAESGQPSSVPSSPHETGLTAEQKARIEGIVDGVLEGMDSASAPSAAPTNQESVARTDGEGEGLRARIEATAEGFEIAAKQCREGSTAQRIYADKAGLLRSLLVPKEEA